MWKFLIGLFLLFAMTSPSAAQGRSYFNGYIMRAVEKIASERAKGGYDIGAYFTQDLKYGAEVIPARRPTTTMCVAAVMEIMIEALNIYGGEGDAEVFEKIPVRSWKNGSVNTLRANIFMYAGTGSAGTGHTLERFGIGEELSFSELMPGDFLNFNRVSGSGHAAVFGGYLAGDSTVTLQYSNSVIGFRYFSAQGKGKLDAGFAYRNAYFDGSCPATAGAVPRDCGIIRSSNRKLLNAGRMFMPEDWNYDSAVAEIAAGVRGIVRSQNPTVGGSAFEKLVNQTLSAELAMREDAARYFDGVTTD